MENIKKYGWNRVQTIIINFWKSLEIFAMNKTMNKTVIIYNFSIKLSIKDNCN